MLWLTMCSLAKKDNMLHTEDYLFGARLTAMGLRDLRKVFDLYGMKKIPPSIPVNIEPSTTQLTGSQQGGIAAADTPQEYEKYLPRAKQIIEKLAAKGKKVTTSNLGASLKKNSETVLKPILKDLAKDPKYEPYIADQYK